VAVEEGLFEESDDVGVADVECALDEGPEELEDTDVEEAVPD